MKVVFDLKAETLEWDGHAPVRCTCRVRNELNGQRPKVSPVVYSENADGSRGVPYMPRQFPRGTWKIVHVKDVPPSNDYEYPIFVSSNAHQPVDRWVEVGGVYSIPAGEVVEDYGYGFHDSTSRTTLGCGRIIESEGRHDHVLAFAADVRAAFARGEVVGLTVV